MSLVIQPPHFWSDETPFSKIALLLTIEVSRLRLNFFAVDIAVPRRGIKAQVAFESFESIGGVVV